MGSSKHFKLRISFNSPVVLTFSLICLIVLMIDSLTNGWTTNTFFSVYRSSLTSPFTYIRFFGHIFGHSGWSHFIGNITLILVIGPLLEEKYGSVNLLIVIAATALVTGLANFIFFPRVQLLGASGVVFAFIILSSLTSITNGSIPMTFILVTLIYIGQQIYQGIFIEDNVSNITHILGGITGAVLGYVMTIKKLVRY